MSQMVTGEHANFTSLNGTHEMKWDSQTWRKNGETASSIHWRLLSNVNNRIYFFFLQKLKCKKQENSLAPLFKCNGKILVLK